MDKKKLMLFESNKVSRVIILKKIDDYFNEYDIYPTRIYIPKTIENKWASLGSPEWDRATGVIFESGIRPVFGEEPVFVNEYLIFWDADKFGLEYREEDVKELRKLGCDMGMHEY